MRDRITKILVLTLLVSGLAAGWGAFELQRFLHGPLAAGDAAISYEIRPGTGLSAVAHELQQLGVLDHPHLLVWYARWRGGADRIQAGEYRIDPRLTPPALLDKLLRGDVERHSLTIPEGWTFGQLLAALRAEGKLEHTLKTDDGGTIMALLGHPDQHPEGMFFPDTYQFTAGTTDLALLRRSYEEMQQRMDEAWRGRAEGLPLQTPYQALILASIVEKETGDPAERSRIAGVFVRRLQKNMRLQTDPTVIYGLGATFDGNLRRRDLEADSPYNTYTRAGLPPTPIALPGAAALHAALHPAAGDELYFVARGDGTHQFSARFEAHAEAVRNYQLHNGQAEK